MLETSGPLESVQSSHRDTLRYNLLYVSRAICVTKELLASLFLLAISFVLLFGQMVAWGTALRENSRDELPLI